MSTGTLVPASLALASARQPWSPETFPDTFGFDEISGGFSKEIGGRRYRFSEVTSADGLHEVVGVQRAAWGWSETDIAPPHILALMPDTEGGVFGAYDEADGLVAFAAGFGGGKDLLSPAPAIISSMLAVASGIDRSQGIGKALKIVQAYHAFQHGYGIMKWFYDPERGANASLNMRKLGARAEEFAVNKYGVMKSELYGPVPTDRFRAVWRFAEAGVVDRILGVALPPILRDVADVPVVTHDNLVAANSVLVQISGDIDEEPEQEKIRRRFNLRKVMSHYFGLGYFATEFISEQDGEGNRLNYYLLKQSNPPTR